MYFLKFLYFSVMARKMSWLFGWVIMDSLMFYLKQIDLYLLINGE